MNILRKRLAMVSIRRTGALPGPGASDSLALETTTEKDRGGGNWRYTVAGKAKWKSQMENMRSSQLDLSKYDSDKIDNHYLEWYDPILAPYLHKQIALLEIGVFKGGSLMLWRDYFPLAMIVGIDIEAPKGFPPTERISIFEGSQADIAFLTSVANDSSPGGFDIIIDDASHMGELTKIAFWHLFDNHLKPGGLYVIEDWGTGYWDDWPDGKSLDFNESQRKRQTHRTLWSRVQRRLRPKFGWPCHSYGMVGFVKQLVDEQGAADVTRKNLSGKAKRESKFERLIISPSIVFVKKRA
jgi:hypothetical protein